MMVQILLLLVTLLLPSLAHAATKYISPAGSNINNGTSTSTPYLTWAYAFSNTSCGDTLIVMDGTFTTATHGDATLTKVCTSGNVFTVQWQNERQALIQNNGNGVAFKIASSAYIDLIGIRAKSTDLAGASTNATDGIIRVSDSDHIRVLRALVYENNRYLNQHGITFIRTTNSLAEDVECYSLHRHCVFILNTSGNPSGNNVVRRVYANGRSRADISGGFQSNYTTSTDTVVSIYPSSDNVVENVFAENVGKLVGVTAENFNRNNRILGSAVLTSLQGFELEARANTSQYQPQNTVFQNIVSIGTTSGNGFYARSAFNTQVTNATMIETGGPSSYMADVTSSGTGGGIYSFYCTNCLSIDAAARPFNIASSQQTWTIDYPRAFGNATAYSPLKTASANYQNTDPDPEADPAFSSCYLWVPDASPMKGAGAGGADIGANILYRYENGTLTSAPLWDTTTGEFPHGAIIAGVNDTASTSAYNMHERFHVGADNGCAFPAGFSGEAPANPANYTSSTGTSTASHAHVIAAGTDLILAGFHLRDAASNVGTVSAVSSSCGGGEALARYDTAQKSPSLLHGVEWWYREDPTAGTCTIAATTSGAVTSIMMTTISLDGVSSIAAAAGAGGLSTSPAVTVTTNTGETIFVATSGRNDTTYSAGADQTVQTDTELSPSRLLISTKSGDDGGVTGGTFGVPTNWATKAISVLPTTPDPPATPAVLTQVAGQVYSAFYVNGVKSALGTVNAANVEIPVGTSFLVCLQTDATDAAAPEAGRKLYFSRNSGAYTAMLDTAVTGISFHGSTVDPNVVTGAVNANLSGVLDNIAGETIHTVNVTPSATMTEDSSLVNCWTVKLTPDAVETDTYEFREYTDAGVALDAYGATADAKITVTGTTPDIQAPTNLKIASSSGTHVSLIWAPSTYATFAGYKVYQGIETGVYDATPVTTITPEQAALLNISPTQWTVQTPIADTYYFVVTAFDLNGNESAVSNEVTAVQAGFTTRTASAGGAAAARSSSSARTPRQAP